MRSCFFCGFPVEDAREVHRSSTCPRCGKDLKICLNCAFYKPGAHWDCAESIDELVQDKERSNFCSSFVFRAAAPPNADTGKKEQSRRKLDKLFGNGN